MLPPAIVGVVMVEVPAPLRESCVTVVVVPPVPAVTVPPLSVLVVIDTVLLPETVTAVPFTGVKVKRTVQFPPGFRTVEVVQSLPVGVTYVMVEGNPLVVIAEMLSV